MPSVFLSHHDEDFANYFGDGPCAELARVAEVRRNRTGRVLSGAELAEAAAGCEFIIAHRATPGQAETFANAPDLVAFLRCAVDISTIDVAAASAAGVLVTRATPGFVDSVAELAIGMMVDVARSVSFQAAAYRDGQLPVPRRGRQLAGATLGLIGFGRIARRVAEIALALRMRVLTHDPYTPPDLTGVIPVELDVLLAESDVVMPLAAATEETEKLMDAAAFARMKRGAYLVNLSRGGLVDETALEEALDSGQIAGAAMDVGRAADQMPSPRLAARSDVVATPHIGGLTPEAAEHQAMDTVRQVAALIAGRKPDGAVNASAAHRLARLGVAVP
jgi:D-3-phosphoglycerate dehydrogenase